MNKILAALMALFVAGAILTGCNGADDAGTDTGTGTTTTTTTDDDGM